MLVLDPSDTREDRQRFWRAVRGRLGGRAPHWRDAQRWLARHDLFYLLTELLGRRDLDHDWLYARCREVESAPDGHLDLWAREHGKTSIITFGKTIQDVLIDREITIAIFSHTRPAARVVLRQIKFELEHNEDLKTLFDDVLWPNPRRQSPKWSEADGLVVRRDGNPKESTIEAWGMVDGLPTGRHFRLRVYDDVIDKKAVTNPTMIRKVTEMWELSLALGTRGGAARYIGTRYHARLARRRLGRGGLVLFRLERRQPRERRGSGRQAVAWRHLMGMVANVPPSDRHFEGRPAQPRRPSCFRPRAPRCRKPLDSAGRTADPWGPGGDGP
jgi:hypothetical protein